ncbi:MAG TPA: DUF488 domain-containing protein [Gemmatimonadales bacterium]|nr:DUF488 domain-containing protein [Gemmatimonadales bacterium]
MAREVWTIGHSTRTLEEFFGLLHAHDIAVLADVRRFPGSKRYPHFGSDALAESARAEGIRYIRLPALGGRRTPRRDSPNTGWKNAAFRAYADHVGTPEFAEGVDELTDAAAGSRLAFMCAEAVWWRCHRRIISDVLTVQGWEVRHILDANAPALHRLDAPAHLVDGALSYEPVGSPGI